MHIDIQEVTGWQPWAFWDFNPLSAKQSHILEQSDYSPRNQRWHPVLSGVFEMFTDFGGQGDAYQDSRGCQAGTLEHFESLTL